MKKLINSNEIVVLKGLKPSEQETNICMVRDSDIAHISTTDNTFVTKLKKVLEKNNEDYKCYAYMSGDEVDSYYIEFPKKYISLRTSSKSRKMTDEQKKAMAERMREARNKK